MRVQHVETRIYRGSAFSIEVDDDVRVHVHQDQMIADEPEFEFLGQLRQRLQHLRRHGRERHGVGIAAVDRQFDRGPGSRP